MSFFHLILQQRYSLCCPRFQNLGESLLQLLLCQKCNCPNMFLLLQSLLHLGCFNRYMILWFLFFFLGVSFNLIYSILFGHIYLSVLFQVSQVYQTMEIETLSQMIPFFDFSVVEKISVDAVRHNFIAMKVDHTKNVVLFGNLVCFILYLCSFWACMNSHLATHTHTLLWLVKNVIPCGLFGNIAFLGSFHWVYLADCVWLS